MAWTREQILAVNDLPLREVEVRAWGEDATVWLRTMTAAERDRYVLLARDPDTLEADPENFRAKLLVFCLCDATGKRLFGDNEAELIGAKCGDAVNSLFDSAQKLNALVPDAVEAARKN